MLCYCVSCGKTWPSSLAILHVPVYGEHTQRLVTSTLHTEGKQEIVGAAFGGDGSYERGKREEMRRACLLHKKKFKRFSS